MAQSDNTMVQRNEREVLVRASFDEDLKWSVKAFKAVGIQELLDEMAKDFQRFTDSELEDLSPANGEPQAVLLQRTAESFGWEVETIQPSQTRREATP